MKYDEQIYRPPKEYKSILLQVTSGCTHNKCKFCGMYRYTNFKMESLEQIEKDIIEASNHPFYRNTKRLFLLNGNPFVLQTERLLKIAELIHRYLPKVEVITTYASIKDIERKTDEELKALKEAGYNDLYIGVESGNQEALTFINKGNTVEEAIREMKRLDKFDYYYYAMILTGLMGKGVDKAIENGRKTGEMLSQVNCRGIFPMSVTIVPGTELWEMYANGEYEEATEYDRLIELREILENLNPQKTALISSAHNSNTMYIKGIVPTEKDRLINEIDEILSEASPEEMQEWIDRRRIRL
ncbi:radical SAM protein [Peptostreptococcus porci]|uniref:radical SAM protein n=1 Tax=Peptostreptococcus porci TaxID=2652282 RepID=UPI0023F2852B|nr:radical SAM protein [Peptostreptococcus porci]MDD7182606.1 radical SAM protein [Peptostreptococcus porci]MDY2793684.1 radical SAM protein [Peptostreptococcus porci]MDY4128580.1 radical SAM protein [Peptostreptococcus porci]MDY4561601.1 radical SAM protein [Peptostreptococcus porci]MDY5436559.1 radical SAM protein [Peptostreptococcus porci]